MLKKLTSPKAKAAKRAPADKELSGLAAGLDDKEPKARRDERSSKAAGAKSPIGKTAAVSTNLKQTKKNMREELSLDMSALADAVAFDESTPKAAEGPLKEESGLGDRRRTLARSPRVKNILNDRDGAVEDADPTPRGKKDAKPKISALASKEPSPASPVNGDKSKKPEKKGGLSGLKAFRSNSKTNKSSEAKHESSDDKDIAASDAASGEDAKLAPSSSAERKLKSGKKADDKFQSKQIDEQLDEASRETDHEEQPHGDSNQKSKSSLSPLRRRKPAPESTETVGRSTKAHLLGHRLKMRELPPANQPEVHIIGEITSGEGFGGGGGFACKWGVEYGSLWHHIAGDPLGQTQIDYPSSSSHPVVWSHPIDLHFAMTSFSGWPKLLLQVWQTDIHMKTNVVGYGFVNLPFAPGEHHLTVSLWRPMGSAKQEMEAKLLGRTQELVSEDVVFNSAWTDRCRLQTTATGKVHVQAGIILRNFHMSDLEM